MKNVKVALLCVVMLGILSVSLFAQETGHKASEGSKDVNTYLALAIGFGLAIAVFGGAIGQGKAIAAAVEAMARQPEAGGRIQGAMIIGLALIETLVIYMLLICFMLLGKFV